MMLVSILTAVYNMQDTIARTIESVLNQSYPNIEYIIIDGMSADGTVETAKAYQSRFDEKKGRSLTIISKPDKGMYDALNKGAKMAHGELIGQINADDWYEPGAVAAMTKAYLDTHYDLAWGNINVYKPSGLMKISNLARLRNGVETIPANIRKNYHLDKLPRGKQRGKFFFGSKIAALNFRKLFGFRKGLGNYAQNPVLA